MKRKKKDINTDLQALLTHPHFDYCVWFIINPYFVHKINSKSTKILVTMLHSGLSAAQNETCFTSN